MVTDVSPAMALYRKKPTRANLLAVVRENQRSIDNIVYGIAGAGASNIVRRRAYIMAAQAIESYDPSRKVPLKNYLSVALQPLHRQVKEIHEPISVPERHRRYQALLAQARTELHDKLDRDPTMEELADHTGLSVRQQKSLEDATQGIFSETAFSEAGASEEGGPSLPGVDKFDPMKEWEEMVYHDLDATDKKIYDARRKGEKSIDLAAKLNITPAAVSQRALKIDNRIARGPF